MKENLKKLFVIFFAILMTLSISFMPAIAEDAVQGYLPVDEGVQSVPEPVEQQEVEQAEETAVDDDVIADNAAKSQDISLVMAVNYNTVVSQGVEHYTTAPIPVLGMVYADVYAMSQFLGYDVAWIDKDEAGFVQISAGEKSRDFAIINTFYDLVREQGRFFIKDDRIYVSLKELAKFCGAEYKYADGMIYIGREDLAHYSAFGAMETSAFDEFVQQKYPCYLTYIVNPYQAYSHRNMLDDAEKLCQMYPDLVKTSVIGASVEFRNLLLVEFGKGDTKIFVCGTHHAREYISTTYLMYAIDRYAYAYNTTGKWGDYNIKKLLDEVTFCIVPMVNPDGVNLVQNGLYSTPYMYDIMNMSINEGEKYGYAAWKANIHGVDVNWNYDKDWSPKKNKKPRGSMGFNGDAPNSEPETVAMCNYLDANMFDAYISFHTQGQIFYWADSASKPVGIYDTLKSATGFTGYRSGADEYGGSFFDYVYRKFDKATVTVELCPYIGNYPYPDEKFDDAWNPAKNVLPAVANQLVYINSLSQ